MSDVQNFLRIHRSFKWEPIGKFVDNKPTFAIVARDELQYFHMVCAKWLPLTIVEDIKPEHPDIIAKAKLAAEQAIMTAAAPPVDRSKVELTDGSPVTDGHKTLRVDGQQVGYVVLSPEERAKGFKRPVRNSYTHVGAPGKGNGCGHVTTMARSIAETYARDPYFYSGTYCGSCGTHFPVGENGQFVWQDGTRVGT